MSNKTTTLKICTIAVLLSVAGIATAAEGVKDASGNPVMGVTQPMMAETMDKDDKMMKKDAMMDDKMMKKDAMMDDKMEKKPMMDDKMKK